MQLYQSSLFSFVFVLIFPFFVSVLIYANRFHLPAPVPCLGETFFFSVPAWPLFPRIVYFKLAP